MSTKEVTAIALRLFSIWLLVQIILNISSVALLQTSIGQYQGEVIPDYGYFMLIGSFIAIGLLAVHVIWASAKSALERCPSVESQSLDLDGQRFLVQLGGAYSIITTLSYLPRPLAFLAHSLGFSYTNFLWPLGLVFQLCIGLGLLVKASHWAVLFAKLRRRQ